MNYARRQQYRRLSRAGRLALASAAMAVVGLFVASVGAVLIGAFIIAVAVVLGLRAHHWLSLAGRSRVGARSEDEVRRELAPLQEEGWRLRHAVRWNGRRDIDSIAIAPAGIGLAIETKTRGYEESHLTRVREQVAWLARRRRRGAGPARSAYCAWFAPAAYRGRPRCPRGVNRSFDSGTPRSSRGREEGRRPAASGTCVNLSSPPRTSSASASDERLAPMHRRFAWSSAAASCGYQMGPRVGWRHCGGASRAVVASSDRLGRSGGAIAFVSKPLDRRSSQLLWAKALVRPAGGNRSPGLRIVAIAITPLARLHEQKR